MITKLIEQELSVAQQAYINYTSRDVQAFFKALDRAVYNGTFSLSLVYWSKQLDHETLVRLTYVLSHLGFVVSAIRKNFAELRINENKLYTLIPKEEVDAARKYYKFNKYVMRKDTKTYPATLVKVGKEIKETGLSRCGFAKVAKNEFYLDRATLSEFFQPIYENVVKSITVAIESGKLKDPYFDDKANFEQVAKEVLEYYMFNDASYNLEYNLSDARGRAIYGTLKRIANPIASKDIRALLVMPTPTIVTRFSYDKLNDIYLFIAELCGSTARTEYRKTAHGKALYNAHKLPDLDLYDSEDRKKLHELIYLSRIYAALDELAENKLVQWVIPLEVDARMSINQFVGALTNDIRLLTRTCVTGTKLQDPWYIEGVRRSSAKKVGTPVFYGSSQTARKLLKSAGISLIPAEIKAINNEFSQGAFAVTKAFKNALIGNYNNHAPSIPVTIWNETFNVFCNKFKTVDYKVVTTLAWDTNANKARLSRTREPVRIPDYRAFKLYWATCLIHNLDSQIANSIAEDFDEWMLTIHDAVIAAPGVCSAIRKAYASKLKDINKDRYSIIQNYRNSIGAVGHKADVSFFKAYKLVVQAPENTTFNPTAMK